MTGADIATWLGVIAALGGLAFAVWKFMDNKINKSEDRSSKKADIAVAKAELTASQFADYKLHIAENYATKAGMTEQVIALTKAVNDVGDRIDKRLDGMTDRLDRVIEAGNKPHRVTRN